MPTTLTNGIQLPDKGSVDWYSSMQSNYNLIDTHLGNTDIHVTAEDKARWDGKANASHTHSSSDITDIGDYATKQYVDNSISGLVDNAPDALNTLNELSAALNDDSNFASTVTNALGAKANSADLATVATSGSYTDLTDKPTINDSTITIQKNGSTVDTFTTNGSAKTIDIPVPTKTSDLTNDSNFVDTSNSAVASGITSAKVTSYDAHIADTDIHVTTADKTKWNNGVTKAYVLRYSSIAITDNSTIAYSTLDNTDNIKVSDKIIDTDGKIFSIVSVDSDNSTVTVGSALIDLALDANVVHTSGNETINGVKTFSDNISTKKIISNVAQLQINARSNADSVAVIAGDNASEGAGLWLYGKNSGISSDCRLQIYNTTKSRFERVDLVNSQWLPAPSGELDCGSASNKYKSFNGINPGSLSLPDLNNGIDISGYITHLDKVVNSYTPPSNGWLSIRVKKTSLAHTSLMIYQPGGLLSSCETTEFGISGTNLPVIANQNVEIYIIADSLASAKFYPCQGNV